MKSRIPRLCLFAACVGASIASAQNQPASPAITEEAQKFLNAPVWYLNYTVTIKLNGTQGSRTDSRLRVVNGTLLLGLRSQGPSLSQITGEAKPPDLMSQLAAQQARALAALGPNADLQAVLAAATSQLGSINSTQVDQARSQLDAFVNNYANWISGVNIDESKSDQENERMLVQVREQNGRATENYRWEYSAAGSAGGRDQGSANGGGTISYAGEPAFEIDGANRKFKLMFHLAFNDSAQTVDSLRGVEERNIGTIHYQRFEIKTGLHSGEQPITETTPVYDVIAGNLPQSFGNISGQSVHSIVQDRLPGTLSVQYVISPNPPIPVELWIDPPANYQRWQPTADQDEKTAGDVIPIKIVLQKPGGGSPQFKPMRYEFFLRDTSREKGICLNWPPPPAAGTPGVNDPPPFDLQFESDKNPDMFVSDEGLGLVETVPTQLEREVKVSCFDYGAYGELVVHAVLENGQRVEGIVRGTTDQKSLKLPARKDGSKIATAFLDDNGVNNLADDDDTENAPVGDGYKGDGLTLYEEYRGFMNGNEWTSADPKKKDVFVLNELRYVSGSAAGIKVFENATSLKVHSLIRKNQVSPKYVINFNRTSGPHVVDQHVIPMVPGLRVSQGATFANALDIGTPGTSKGIVMPPDLAAARGGMFFVATVAHELLHCVNVYHHGEKDTLVWWHYTPNNDPYDQMYESRSPPGVANPLQNAVKITVKEESGTVVLPSNFFMGNTASQAIDIGLIHGQHSGTENCLMRYGIAFAYFSNREHDVRYLTTPESEGLSLCTSAAGTGVNAAGRSPQSRYGTAATPATGGFDANGGNLVSANRGDCVHQIRVNDFLKPPDQLPTR